MNKRKFKNNYEKFDGHILFSELDLELEISLKTKIYDKILSLIKELEANYEIDYNNSSIYTGVAGVALLYYKLSIWYPHESAEYLNKSKLYIEKCLLRLKGKVYSFHCGDSGILAVAAVIYNSIGEKAQVEKLIQKLISYYSEIIKAEDIPDELLYGRSGYLFALFFLNKYMRDSIDEKLIIGMATKILDSGKNLAAKEKNECPLMFEWHGKKYLGAAHGLAAILYLLMKLSSIAFLRPEIEKFVRPTIDYVLNLKYKSGNFPSSIDSQSEDRLVHWCHGAPGWIYTLISAYQLFGDSKYLSAAEDCISVIWDRGLLTKGYGICHGVAGNAYAFLAMFNLTGDQKYLYMATKFGEWCCDYGKHGCRIADRPYSLYEGMAGTIYFLCDLIHPTIAKFPAYEI